MPSHEIPLAVRLAEKAICRGFIELTSRGIHIEGREHLPKRPPFLMAFNHFGWVEGLVPQILLLVKDFPYMMTKIENIPAGKLGAMFSSLGFIGIRRGEADMRALRRALALLKDGRVIATAPEGTRGRGAEQVTIKDAKGGLIFLATQFKDPLPIVPMAIWGQNEWTFPYIDVNGFHVADLQNLRKEPLFVHIGEPFIPLAGEREQGMNGSAVRNALADELMQRIENLLPVDYRRETA